MTEQEKITRAYNKANARIQAILKRLASASEQNFSVNPAKAHWGDVGDIHGIEEQLKEISDSVFHENEYEA